jgi:chemotaxis protein CheZ
MPVRRKVFRIEEMQHASADARAPVPEPATSSLQQKILEELAALRVLLQQRPARSGGIDAGGNVAAEGLRQLKDETDTIQRAINRTKQEIATLHVNGLNAPESGRAFRELDAVVGGTEQGIQRILASAEDIDEAANTLSALLKDERERALAQDIRDQVTHIFEASNFQDLTGQRIAKVMATLKFIEDRISRMMEIWGGIEAFKDYTAAALAERDGGPALLNGPKLEGDAGHVSQDQIDAMFR